MFSVCGMISIIICSKPKISTDYSRFIQYAYIENIDGSHAGETHQSHVYKCRNLFYSCNMEEMYLLLWYILKDSQMKGNRFGWQTFGGWDSCLWQENPKIWCWILFFWQEKLKTLMLNFSYFAKK